MININLKYDQTVSIDPAKAPAEFVAWALAFAIRQSAGDADAGKAGTDEGKLAVMEKATRLAAFEVPVGGAGGARLSTYERALRDVVEAILRDWGYKAVDAKKAAMDPQAGFESGIQAKLAKRDAVPEAQVNPDDVAEVFGKNWPNIEAKAKTLAAQSAIPSVEF